MNPWMLIAAGLLIGSVPGTVFLIWASWVNPFFMDGLLSYSFWAFLLPSIPVVLFGGYRYRKGRSLPHISRRALVGVSASWLILVVFCAYKPRPVLENTEMLVVGWDGATFQQMDPLQKQGRLPEMDRLRQEGTSAVLMSMEPMFSPLLWTSIATGKAPEEHGIQGFSVHASDVQTPRFWDLVEQAGGGIGIYKWLVTYPPRVVKGFIVPAWLAPAPVTWPVELAVVKEIELSNRLERRGQAAKKSGLRLLMDGIRQGFRWSTVRQAVGWKLREWREHPEPRDRRVALENLRVRMDRDVFISVATRTDPELLTFTLYSIDALGHRFWAYHEPQAFPGLPPGDVEKYGEVVREAYENADEVLGEFLARVPAEAIVVVLSDHGFKALKQGSAAKSFFSPKTERLQARLTQEVGPVDVFRVGQRLTVALRDSETSIEELFKAVDSLKDETGAPFFVAEQMPDAPRSVGLSVANEVVDAARIESGKVGGEPLGAYLELGTNYTGDHDPEGIFVIRGGGAVAGEAVRDMHLLDVSPTLQALLGHEPAQDLVGQVRFGETERGPASRDAWVEQFEWLESESEETVNNAQLRALGYIQ